MQIDDYDSTSASHQPAEEASTGLLAASSTRPSFEEDHGAELDDLSLQRPQRARSSTLGGFAFASNLLHLAASADSPTLKRRHELSAVHAAALMIGSQVGAGIFSSPGVVLADTWSTGSALLVWLAAGLLAWSGAASFAELGAAIPLNGGPQAFLQYSFGPLPAFLFSWSSITALKPGGQGAVSLVFAEYMCRVLYHTAFSASSEESVKAIPKAVVKLVAIASIALVAGLNIWSSAIGTRATTILTFIKICALLMVMIVGLVQLARGKQSPALQTDIFADSSTSASSYALALYSGLWAFSGWDQLSYVGGDLKRPQHLPRIIHSSMALVLTLYLIANLSYFIVLPTDLIAHSNTVALDFGKSVLGPVGGLIFALLVALSCFGMLNGDMFASSRLIAEAGSEGFLPKMFSKYHPQRRTPIAAIVLQSSLTSLLILLGDFKALVIFSSVSAFVWFLACIGALLVLRVREPDLNRPYKTWITTPILFACVATFLLCMPIFSAPLEALAAFAFIAAGVPVYFAMQYHEMAGGWVKQVFAKSREGYQPTATEEDVPMTERHQSH